MNTTAVPTESDAISQPYNGVMCLLLFGLLLPLTLLFLSVVLIDDDCEL